ncbi:MAG TPA: DUF2550 domain-containing protein [Nocardioides sp.]|uniref:DUF2550 domain-containing protein n=1 Tax=Nocardioides sp. TaxID=35761 RepID=UPI002BC79E18|nr:DUF2550 domain-containing protein [Nocardioides sp.]HQR25820.1 DUF2550 domain-containing protein [Nocardioides sp.]
MPVWQVLLDAVGVVLLLILLYGVALVLRRRGLARSGVTFELSYRARSDKAGRGWLLGLGRYSGEYLQWYRVFSLSPRPKRSWNRADLEYAGRRDPVGLEAQSLYADHVVVTCDTPWGDLELAMTPGSLMGFQAWLEAMPPGTRGVRPGDTPGIV